MIRTLIALVALLAPLPALAQPLTPTEAEAIDELVTKTLAETAVPSAQIAVVRDGKIILSKAYGKASEAIPASRTSLPYQIASNSKQFTAMAMLLLEDEGKLSLDDKVSKYLPGISGGDRIALRQLVSHTSGLQDYWPQDYSFEAMSRPVTPQGILDIWAKKPLDFQPGEQWQYSNTGFVVAGLIIEKVSGEPLMEFLQRRIFRPLGMTSVRNQDDSIGPAFPQGYGRYALGPVRPVTPAARGWLYAAGELSMTAQDLAKWDVARLNRALLPAEDWEAQEKPVLLNDGTPTNYGLGVFIRESNGRRVINHGGESVGFLSVNNVYPEEKAAVVVLTNSWSGPAYGVIARGIANIILPPTTPPVDAKAEAAVKRARFVFDQLRAGKLDRSLLTKNANYYFTKQALSDFQSSLAPLGEPISFESDGPPVHRGGFVIQGYTIKYPGRTLDLSTFYEPGPSGRIEQFLVGPAA